MKRRLKFLMAMVASLAALGATVALGGCSEGTTDEFFCDHKFEVAEVTKESSCSEEGSQKVTCTECGVTEIEVIEKLPHTEVYVAMIPATCLEDGATDGKKCSVCEEWTVAPATIPALGHKKVIDKAVAPGCMETGLTAGSHCGRCEIVLEEQAVVAATGHDVVSDIEKEPTCFESGSTASRYCANCETVFAENEYLASLDHNFENGYCTHCGIFELEQLLTMESSQYTATAVAKGTTLEKGAIYRIKNLKAERMEEYENGEVDWYSGVSMKYLCSYKYTFSSEYKDYYLYENVSAFYLDSFKGEYGLFYLDFYYGLSEDYGMNGSTVEDLHWFMDPCFGNINFETEDESYLYFWVPENVFTDGNVTVTLLAGEGFEKITLK
ncbi:MAG: hypothetical protein IJ506_07440 [Clostridia bacterium]|nr:hypothetical protein [Clostridia bacterium]